MAKEKFVEHSFNKASLALIGTCSGILEEYRQQGYRLSLRQLYYQLVARDFIENSVKSYKRTGDLVSNARKAGLLDWEMIEDRGREAVVNSHWKGQGNYVEVFVEKDALSGILLPVCRALDVRFTANKGYSSDSAMYEAAKRLIYAGYYGDDIKNVHVIYLGDHDPSGIDMTRDIRERFELYTRGRIEFEVHRLALNFDQVEMWNPPENPAKESDSRYEGYAAKFGESSWELDAVEPATLAGLVREQIEELIDQGVWDEVENQEDEYIRTLNELADNFKA
jgi:hypothetical protein